jgi:hypothetical protein
VTDREENEEIDEEGEKTKYICMNNNWVQSGWIFCFFKFWIRIFKLNMYLFLGSID